MNPTDTPNTPAPDAMPEFEDNIPELKPCPFCGGEADIENFDAPDRNYYTVMCNNCPMDVVSSELYIDDAIRIWNTRAYHNTALEQVARQMAEALAQSHTWIGWQAENPDRIKKMEAARLKTEQALAAYEKLMEGK